MSLPLAVVPLRACAYLVWTEVYTETLFYASGRKAKALSSNERQKVELAGRLGYGSDVALMDRQHDLIHTLLAEARGLDHSPTLHDVAHGVPDPVPQYHWDEEGDVLALQRYLRTGEIEPRLQGWRIDVVALRDRVDRTMEAIPL